MKKIKLLTPIMSVLALTGASTALVGCACKSKQSGTEETWSEVTEAKFYEDYSKVNYELAQTKNTWDNNDIEVTIEIGEEKTILQALNICDVITKNSDNKYERDTGLFGPDSPYVSIMSPTVLKKAISKADTKKFYRGSLGGYLADMNNSNYIYQFNAKGYLTFTKTRAGEQELSTVSLVYKKDIHEVTNFNIKAEEYSMFKDIQEKEMLLKAEKQYTLTIDNCRDYEINHFYLWSHHDDKTKNTCPVKGNCKVEIGGVEATNVARDLDGKWTWTSSESTKNKSLKITFTPDANLGLYISTQFGQA